MGAAPSGRQGRDQEAAQGRSIGDDIDAAYKLTNKSERSTALNAARAKAAEAFAEADAAGAARPPPSCVKKLEADVVRGAILKDGRRIDGRDTKTVRPIEAMVGFLPRTHGSALFTRGETQAIVTTTLGTKEAEQMIDGLEGLSYQRFMLHYNFPPYSVGEVGRFGAPGGAKSATASSPGARSTRCCRASRSSPTPSASSPTSPSPTARRRWRRSAAAASR